MRYNKETKVFGQVEFEKEIKKKEIRRVERRKAKRKNRKIEIKLNSETEPKEESIVIVYSNFIILF